MWPLERSGRYNRPAGRIEQPSNTLDIIGLPRDQDLEIIGDTDQTSIEHPMGCPR